MSVTVTLTDAEARILLRRIKNIIVENDWTRHQMPYDDLQAWQSLHSKLSEEFNRGRW